MNNHEKWPIDSGVLSRFLYSENDDFLLYMAFVNWLTAVFTGLRLEIMFMATVYLRNGWTKMHENQWKIACQLFSLLALTTLGLAAARNHLALITLVRGLYKVSAMIPTTRSMWYLIDIQKNVHQTERFQHFKWCSCHQSSAFQRLLHWCTLLCTTDSSLLKVERISLALDSDGLLLYHSSAALLICMLLNGVATPDKFLLAPILIVCMQRWFTFLSYYLNLLYNVIVFFLEITLQWSVMPNFEHWAQNHWTVEVAASGMILAHWIWFVPAPSRIPSTFWYSRS